MLILVGWVEFKSGVEGIFKRIFVDFIKNGSDILRILVILLIVFMRNALYLRLLAGLGKWPSF